MSYNPRVTSYNPRVTSSNPRVTSSNPRVTSSNLQVTSSNPRIIKSMKTQVSRLKSPSFLKIVCLKFLALNIQLRQTAIFKSRQFLKVTVWKCCFHFKFSLDIVKIRSGVITLSHKGILNKYFCNNFFEKNLMPVFLWRFEYGRRRLNSNKESHGKATGFRSLRINCWNITQVIWI